MKNKILELRKRLLKYGAIVPASKWQSETCRMNMIELTHINCVIPMIEAIDNLNIATNALQPWCDIHFKERVSGEPLNPPPSHREWLKGNEKYMMDDKFSHSYPERYWPKTLMSDGIRFKTADLNDLISLLKKDKSTRQAYLPIFFPEDLTAALNDQRIPCTLGYQILIRNGQLDITYHMRSCDAIRHMHNDIYLTNRLAIYIRDAIDINLKLGMLHFNVTSLHCFENDRYALKKLIGDN